VRAARRNNVSDVRAEEGHTRRNGCPEPESLLSNCRSENTRSASCRAERSNRLVADRLARAPICQVLWGPVGHWRVCDMFH